MSARGQVRCYHGRLRSVPDVVVNVRAESPGKARAEIARMARDAAYHADVTDVQVRVGEWIHGFSVWLEHPSRSAGAP